MGFVILVNNSKTFTICIHVVSESPVTAHLPSLVLIIIISLQNSSCELSVIASSSWNGRECVAVHVSNFL